MMNDETQFAEDVRVTFAVEPFKGEDWEDFLRMQEAHFREVALGHRPLMTRVNPDFDRYLLMEKNGRLHVVKARSWNKSLVGYSIHMVYNHLHYKHLLVAEDDVFYVAPTVRGRGVARYMRAYACNTLKERGVQIVAARVKPHIPMTHLEKLGYQPLEIVYSKVL